MKTLNVIYCLRIGFGILAALVAALVVNLKVGNPLINGITVALAVYILTYYLLKFQFANKVEKPTKILTMGYGIYALTFIFCWVLFITPFLVPPTATFTMDPQKPVVNNPVIFNATASVDPDGTIVKYAWDFGDGNKGTGANITHTYTVADEYTVKLTVVDDHGISSKNTTPLNVTAPS